MTIGKIRRYVARYNRRDVFLIWISISRSLQCCSFGRRVRVVSPRFVATLRKIRNCFGSTTVAAARERAGGRDCRGQVSISRKALLKRVSTSGNNHRMLRESSTNFPRRWLMFANCKHSRLFALWRRHCRLSGYFGMPSRRMCTSYITSWPC